MNIIFMKSKYSKTSDPHRLFLNLTDITTLKSDKYVALSNLSIYYAWKKIRTIILEQPQHRMKNLNYLMDHILYQVFKIIFNINQKTVLNRL